MKTYLDDDEKPESPWAYLGKLLLFYVFLIFCASIEFLLLLSIP